MERQALPELFCWSRFGTEAGETIEQILERKEAERLATGGTFYWGIGNSVGPGMIELIRRCPEPEVLFSPIKSRPRPVDVAPGQVVRWRLAEGLNGEVFELPQGVCVTSQAPATGAKRPRYALVCAADEPLRLAHFGRLTFADIRNLRSGNRLGPSQVTAVVRRAGERAAHGDDAYRVALRARLAKPYFVRLREPTAIADDLRLLDLSGVRAAGTRDLPAGSKRAA